MRKIGKKGRINIGVSPTLRWKLYVNFTQILFHRACFGRFLRVVAGCAGKKKNHRKLACFQWFSLVQNGGRSRTRIYDLHDVNVEE